MTGPDPLYFFGGGVDQHEKQGHETSALRCILAQESVDLIILDLMLQDAKATDVLGELRETHPNIPIFLVTGHLDELDLEKAGQFGITQFFVKPVHVEPFGQAIENTLQESA